MLEFDKLWGRNLRELVLQFLSDHFEIGHMYTGHIDDENFSRDYRTAWVHINVLFTSKLGARFWWQEVAHAAKPKKKSLTMYKSIFADLQSCYNLSKIILFLIWWAQEIIWTLSNKMSFFLWWELMVCKSTSCWVNQNRKRRNKYKS